MDKNTKAILRRLKSELDKERDYYLEKLSEQSKDLRKEIKETKNELSSHLGSEIATREKNIETQLRRLKLSVFGDTDENSLTDPILGEVHMTNAWLSRLDSELSEKINALEANLAQEVCKSSSTLYKDELYSTVAVLREETKNKVTNLSVQTERKFTDFDRRLSQSALSNKTDFDSLRVRIASLEATLASITKENRQLKRQLIELTPPKNEEYSSLRSFGAVALFIFIVLVVIAVN